LLIEALAALGRRDEVHPVYRRTYEHLVEHGLEPDPMLASTYRDALRGGARPPQVSPTPTRPDSISFGMPSVGTIFTGRDAELDRVVEAMRRTTRPGAAVCVISGMAGVGKTTLAVHAARSLAAAYPDGCLFVDLYGYTAAVQPEEPGEVLDRLLRRLGVAGAQIPHNVDDRAAVFRQRLDGRQLLLLLDNARDAAQVKPLLPQVSGCGALITSRTRLAALDEADLLSLDVLANGDGAALFQSVAGPRTATEPGSACAVDRIVARCGGLPLAVRIAAARYRSEPMDTLADLCSRLDDEHVRLAELDDGDRSVAASLAVSYANLPPDQQRAFALLGVHPGTGLDAYAAAALVGMSVGQARRLLDGLVDRHLLNRPAPGRYQLHDLVAAFARGILSDALTERDRAQALRRLLDYYLQVAEQADIAITPHRHRVPLAIEYRPTATPSMINTEAAMRWLTTEEATLVGISDDAANYGFDIACWQLSYTLRGYFFLTKRWQPWLRTHKAALAAARRLGDPHAEAMTLNNLGLAAIEQGQPEVAATHYQAALTLFQQLDDAHGECTARANLAWIDFNDGRYDEFLNRLRLCHAFYEQSRSRRNAAITLRGIALGEVEIGEFTAAVEHLQQVRGVFEELGLDLDLAMAVNALGEAHARSGDNATAGRCHREALELSRRCGSTFEQARAHHRLGDLASAVGDFSNARRHWVLALGGYDTLSAPQAGEVRTRLDALKA
jgi:tetratricopeptide (TPR) repeat protein